MPFKPQSFGWFHIAVILSNMKNERYIAQRHSRANWSPDECTRRLCVFPRLIANSPWRMHSHCYLCSHLCLNLSCKLQTVLALKSLAFLRAVRTHQELDVRWKAASQARLLTVPTARTPRSGLPRQSKKSANTSGYVVWTEGIAHAQSGATGKQFEVSLIPGNQIGFLPALTRTPQLQSLMAPVTDTFTSHAEETTKQGGFVTPITKFLHCGHEAWNGSKRLPRREAVTYGQGGVGTADGEAAAAFTLLLAVASCTMLS